MEPVHPIKKRCVRITSNGIREGTRIYLPNGTDISRLVRGVSWELGEDGVTRATLQLVAATFESCQPESDAAEW